MDNQIPNMPIVDSLQPTEFQPSTNRFLVILLSILLIISMSIAGFFAYQTQKLVVEVTGYREQLKQTLEPIINNLQPDSIPDRTAEPVATESSEVDTTANWKSFTSVNYGFAVKYPQDWLGECKDITGGWETWESASICELRAPNTDPYTTKEFITISVQKPLPERNTLAEIVAFELKNFGHKLSLQSINGVGGYFYTNKDSSVFFTKKGNYFIVINWFPIPENNKYKTTLDQIISTFKFTN